MRTSLLIISLLISFCPALIGQHNLFIQFGKSANEVKSFLYSRDYVDDVSEDSEVGRLRVALDPNKHIEYGFIQDRHYSTTITRNYTNRKTAKDVEKNCLSYMNSVKTSEIKLNEVEKISCYTAIADDKIIKLFIIRHPESITLTLAAFSRYFGPMQQESRFFYEVDLLERIYAAN